MTFPLLFSLLGSKSIKWLIFSCLTVFLTNQTWAESAFLKPSEAFKLQVNEVTKELQWTIADGYYLYESRVKASLTEDKETPVSFRFLTQSVEKNDPNFGLVTVFHDRMAIVFDDLPAGVKDIKLSYQGCADAGLCYPPQTRILSFNNNQTVAKPIMKSVAKPLDSAATLSTEGEESQLAKLLLDGDRFWVLVTFFVLGLGLTFTPCVLPMIPILAGIIAGQSTNITAKKGFFLSLSYVLGMSFSYTTAGVLVGIFGAQLNLQAIFQTPSVLIGFSVLFVLLSLSMFGFYELQLPMFLRDRLDKLSQKSVGGPYLGIAIMGAISALIVSPCVSAPLAGALIYISTTGDAVLGGSVLFVMSLGMGVPLLLVGLGGGKYLPKAGMWMMQVKALFGVILLAVAIALVSRILSDSISIYLWATLCILYAVQLSPFQTVSNGWGKIRQGLAFILFIYGMALLSSGLAGKPNLEQPLAYLSVSASNEINIEQVSLFNRIEEVSVLDATMLQASKEGKSVVVDMYADWCTACLVMEKEVFNKSELQRYANEIVFLQLDLTKNTSQQQTFLSKYGVFGPPTLLFFSSDGDLVNIRQGEIGLESFKESLQSTLAAL